MFPTTTQQGERSAEDLADEEATTELEETGEAQKKKVTTPVKKSFQTATPPPTEHRTRSKQIDKVSLSPDDRDMEYGNLSLPKRKRVSPFDGWARTKPGVAGAKGKKREGEALEKNDGDGGKRTRSAMSSFR